MKEKIVKQELWESAYNCPECTHVLKRNTEEVWIEKKKTLKKIRENLAGQIILRNQYKEVFKFNNTMECLNPEGRFVDIEESIENLVHIIQRLVILSESFNIDTQSKEKLFKAISYYLEQETSRTDLYNNRFHSSIFAIPGAAVNLYNIFYKEMIEVEEDKCESELTKEVYSQLMKCMMQAWLLPLRGNHTDKHPISPERFRGHAWWVGGNAISYRPIFYTAIILQSVEMMDTVCYIIKNIFTETSANDSMESFWSEGICADGFGWGHGRQAYNEGYPIDAITKGMEFMGILKGTPWQEELREININCLLHFIKGSSWSHYRGKYAPMQSRMIFSYKGDMKVSCLAAECVPSILENMDYLLEDGQKEELERLYEQRMDIKMLEYPEGDYRGTRYFWNNDSLIKKVLPYYIYINMASSRCDGVECAAVMADTMNFFMADGSYVVVKDGDEYQETMGAWELSLLPGVTGRYIQMDEIVPENNWKGYSSIHNFAGGIGKGKNGVAGFIYEKNKNKRGEAVGVGVEKDFNKALFGIRANKSYFIIEDTMVCLGAGITDKCPELDRSVWTSINQTKWDQEVDCYKDSGDGVDLIRETMEGNTLVIDVKDEEEETYYFKQKGILYGVVSRYTNGKITINCEERIPVWDKLNVKNKVEEKESNLGGYLEWIGGKQTYLDKLNMNKPEVKYDPLKVLQIGIEHGKGIIDNKYAYWMYLGEQEPKVYIKENPVKIIENNTYTQIVGTQSEDILQIIFYEDNSSYETEKWMIKASHKLVIMLEKQQGGYDLTVCDPTQNTQIEQVEIELTLKEKTKRLVCIQMPKGHDIGKSKSMKINF
ncbi:MAG: polysaccharide lyase family 8 super-sandwich domain-containing protein [Cellulosilyticaceae bacterium]